ncbi:transporter [Geotalea sp. SG265]|uniref:transporter n=1 Tax=Geotalea sp. SG265 TaxID=2922867 RepID=UPI001FAF8839|nr:transporter [Geotalea sp. SG265]
MIKSILKVAAVTILAIGVTSAAEAADQLFSVGLGFEFTSGSYGTPVRTDAVLVPVTVAVTPGDRAAFSVEIPWVRQSNSNVMAGQFLQMLGQQTGMATVTGVMGTPGSGSGMTGSGTTSMTTRDTSKAQSGLGDITLRAGYIIAKEGEIMPQIRPRLSLKIPTADSDRGLGTGKFDEGFAVEFSKWFGDWQSFVEPGYTLQGKASGLSLKNYFSLNGGVGYQLTDSFMPALVIKSSTPLIEGASGLLEARLKLIYQATSQVGIEGYAAKGMNSATADYSAGLTIYYDL